MENTLFMNQLSYKSINIYKTAISISLGNYGYGLYLKHDDFNIFPLTDIEEILKNNDFGTYHGFNNSWFININGNYITRQMLKGIIYD
jgi:hypothetical protein